MLPPQHRRTIRERQIGLVHHLAEQGFTQRAISRQTGLSCPTVKKWLQLPRPDLPRDPILAAPDQPQGAISSPAVIKYHQIRQAQALAQEKLSYSEISRRVGVHRVTIKKSLQAPLPPEVAPVIVSIPVNPEPPLPPAPWTRWDQVKQTREALQQHRFLCLRRPEHLNAEEQAHLAALRATRWTDFGRACLVDWYQIWHDDTGQRRSLAEAKARYESWQPHET